MEWWITTEHDVSRYHAISSVMHNVAKQFIDLSQRCKEFNADQPHGCFKQRSVFCSHILPEWYTMLGTKHLDPL